MKYYETGGVPPAPQYMMQTQRKCEFGHIWVGNIFSSCPECARKVTANEKS